MAVSFEAILKVLRDGNKTEFQKAADLHALIDSDTPVASSTRATAPARGRPRKAAAVNGAEQQHSAGDPHLGLNE